MGKRAQPLHAAISLTDFGDLEIWIHGGVADAAGVDAANYVYTADVVDVERRESRGDQSGEPACCRYRYRSCN